MIGVFDSGFGGLTVHRALIKALPDRTALCSIKVHDRTQVHTIKTRDLGPPPVTPERLEAHLSARRRAIFTRMTREGLLRPRAEVEAEIAKRQDEDGGTGRGRLDTTEPL